MSDVLSLYPWLYNHYKKVSISILKILYPVLVVSRWKKRCNINPNLIFLTPWWVTCNGRDGKLIFPLILMCVIWLCFLLAQKNLLWNDIFVNVHLTIWFLDFRFYNCCHSCFHKTNSYPRYSNILTTLILPLNRK